MESENCNLQFEICPPSQIPLLQFEICILKSASSEPDLAFEMPAEAMHMLFGLGSWRNAPFDTHGQDVSGHTPDGRPKNGAKPFDPDLARRPGRRALG